MSNMKASRVVRRGLVLEDNLDHFNRINGYLTQAGYQCVRAKTESELREGLSDAQERRKFFEFVMIDVDLSESGESNTGFKIYESVLHDFPHENYVIYTSQAVERFRDDINRMMYRDVHLVLLDEVLDARSVRMHLSRLIQGGGGRSVFLVHGRNSQKNAKVRKFLKKGLGLNIVEWETARECVRGQRDYIYDIVLQGIEMSDVTVVLFTDDEEVRLRQEFLQASDYDSLNASNAAPRRQSRPNVYIEAGYAMGRRPKRTIFVVWPDNETGFEFPSDFDGLHVVRFNGSAKSRETLMRRLEAARCRPTRRRDWKKFKL